MDEKYKEYLSKCHPELLGEAEDFVNGKPVEKAKPKKRTKMDRGSWEYICKLFPKLKNYEHERMKNDGTGISSIRQHAWYVHAPVKVGSRTATIGVTLFVYTHIWDKNYKKIPLESKQHHLEFYLWFDNMCTCYMTMTNLPGRTCQDGHGNKYPIDLITQRKRIYKHLGIE